MNQTQLLRYSARENVTKAPKLFINLTVRILNGNTIKSLLTNSGILFRPGERLCARFSTSTIAVHSRCHLIYISSFTKFT